MVPPPSTPKNAGVGIRIYTVPVVLYPVDLVQGPLWVTDIFVNDGGETGASDYLPIGAGGNNGSILNNNWWTNASIEIRLREVGYTGVLLPLDSRLVDRFTIESTGNKPSDWQENDDLYDALGILG
jgi:hypothetical protein